MVQLGRRIKVLYIVSRLRCHGPISQLYNLIKYMDKQAFDITILTLSPEAKDSRLPEFRGLGIKCHSLRLSRSTGQGFGARYEYWSMALELIGESPIIGHGFGQELILFERVRGEGMCHNAFLSVGIEGGLLGLLLFILPLVTIIRYFWRRFRNRRHHDIAVVCLAFMAALIIMSMTQSVLYWYKSHTIALALIISVIGFED